ncbi:MAG: nucleotidyltransferase family protein [bacterium]
MDAIILAGGLGTRLRHAVDDLPKPMAPVCGRPFLDYLLDYALRWQVERAILATGYLHQTIEAHYGNSYKNLAIAYSVEREPLGTGGCIQLACRQARSEHVFILNGDTFFDVDLGKMMQGHLATDADMTIALKPMHDVARYGVVRFEGSRITRFEEKKKVDFGHINGGVYVARKTLFEGLSLPDKFSLEEDVLRKFVQTLNLQCFLSDTYFIDIGIPEDYYRAQDELKVYARES